MRLGAAVVVVGIGELQLDLEKDGLMNGRRTGNLMYVASSG